MIEIHKRQELSIPLLGFISEVNKRLKEPVIKFIEKLTEFRSMKSHMERRNYKEVIAKFLSVICQKDHDLAKVNNHQIPNNPNMKTKREQIFEELN